MDWLCSRKFVGRILVTCLCPRNSDYSVNLFLLQFCFMPTRPSFLFYNTPQSTSQRIKKVTGDRSEWDSMSVFFCYEIAQQNEQINQSLMYGMISNYSYRASLSLAYGFSLASCKQIDILCCVNVHVFFDIQVFYVTLSNCYRMFLHIICILLCFFHFTPGHHNTCF